MDRQSKNVLIVLFVLILFGASVPILPAGAPSNLPNVFKSIGYLPSWSGDIESIPYRKLTHICYAFMTHEADGSGTIPDVRKLQRLIALAHRNGVQVLISIGGWSGTDTDSAFESLSANETSVSKFITNVSQAIKDNTLDGVDIDWEYPHPDSAGRFTDLIQRLHAELDKSFGPRSKLVTVAVASDDQGAWYTQGISPDIFSFVDWVNIMAYDGPAVPHANYEWATASFNFWVNTKKLPVAKAVLGVPFYSRPREMSYKDIIAANPGNAQMDCIPEGCYNGIPTISRKTQYVLKAGGGGMMYWELSQDARGRFSLVDTIYREVLAFAASKRHHAK